MNKAPAFWEHKTGLSVILLPLSWLWRAVTFLRLKLIKAHHAPLPVICVGNIYVGGTGKTPLSAGLCQMLKQQGFTPCILMRGYGGREGGPLFVDPASQSASDVGDEALMLSLYDHVCVSRDRIAGARFIARYSPCDIIVMDDGMQNPWLAKDLTIGVFDGAAGLGNERILPAGPLRQSLASGLELMDIAVVNGTDKAGLTARLSGHLPVLQGELVADSEAADALRGRAVLGFAGIGRPERFFDSLRRTGACVEQTLAFGDHHTYSEADLARLRGDAHLNGLDLVTTRKDWVRLPPLWREHVSVLSVTMQLKKRDQKLLMTAIMNALEKRG